MSHETNSKRKGIHTPFISGKIRKSEKICSTPFVHSILQMVDIDFLSRKCHSKIQKDIILGSLLGDGHLEKNGNHHRIPFDHSSKQREWILWKWEALKPYVTKVVEYQVVDKRTGKVCEKIRFNTSTHPLFSEYHRLFYDGKRKRIPAKLQSLLATPLSLAVWYLDDGALRPDCKAFRLHTKNFSLGEVHSLQKLL